MISGFSGKGVFFGNMKGGVGKSTLCVYTLEMIQKLKPELDILLIDTDPQATSSSMMTPILGETRVRFMPVGDRFDGTIMSMIDGVIKTHLVNENTLVIVDTAAGKIGNIWQIALLCNTMIVPTSLSWTDMRPSMEYVSEIDMRKNDYTTTTPHVIVVPNRVSPNQRDYSLLYNAAQDLNVVISPPVSDFSIVKHSSHNFNGLKDIEGSRFYDEVENLAKFIISHVLTGKLDDIYGEN